MTYFSAPEERQDIMATYLLNILSAVELKKPVSKRVPKNLSLVLSSSEPWETMEAQLLAKIDTALKPKTLNLNDYNIMFHIPRLLPKPGMTLADKADYSSLLGRVKTMATKNMPTINITIAQKESEIDKENIVADSDEDKKEAKKKKKVSICVWCHNLELAEDF
jgi:hypothetical protein